MLSPWLLLDGCGFRPSEGQLLACTASPDPSCYAPVPAPPFLSHCTASVHYPELREPTCRKIQLIQQLVYIVMYSALQEKELAQGVFKTHTF